MMKQIIILLTLITVILSEEYYLLIREKKFPFTLEDNNAANKLKEKLSLKLEMKGDISHEKYYQFKETFKTNIYSPGTIEEGDILLYQNDYLVLFYETFSTSYSYTKLGKVTSTDGLKDALGNGDITVSWCKGDCSDIKNSEQYVKFNFIFFIFLFILLVFK